MANQTRPYLIFIIITFFNPTQSKQPPDYYNLCKPFSCGNITFTFPFYSLDTIVSGQLCGLPRFQIACDTTTNVSTLELSGRSYKVKELFLSDRLITIVDLTLINDLKQSTCKSLRNLTIPIATNLMLPLLGLVNLTIFECSNNNLALSGSLVSEEVLGNFTCSDNEGFEVYILDGTQRNSKPLGPVETPSGCEYVTVPVSAASLPRLNRNVSGFNGGDGKLVTDVLNAGFPLQWPEINDCQICQGRGGRCVYNGEFERVECFCKGGCNSRHKSNKWKVIVGVAILGSRLVFRRFSLIFDLSIGATTGSIALLAVVLLLMFKYGKRISAIFKPYDFGKNQVTGGDRNVKEFIKTYQSTLLTNYSYNDLKKMTDGFKETLGKGGYGNVFKGSLSDGRLVAVKMLENYGDNHQNFLNEITTIGRIHHVNVIRLLGFSCDGSKQALIYEYMPNKSLGDLLSTGDISVSLGLTKLLEISIGVAHGIEYLHNGCDSRILHLDIKPQNVLLDQDFNPKISDFGLAKVYSRNRSAATMTGARGTIGFIAPEIFLRNLGNPSQKSDVYSFGMLLLEMVGAKRPVKPDINTSSEVYFPGWIYDKLIEEREMEIQDSIVGEEVHIARKMVMVGLWCIQINPKDRPFMTGVIEMLSGNVEAIEMPPKPFFFSPPRVQFEQQEINSIESISSDLPLTSVETIEMPAKPPFFSPPRVQFEQQEINSIESITSD